MTEASATPAVVALYILYSILECFLFSREKFLSIHESKEKSTIGFQVSTLPSKRGNF